jgi:hypothetical protein
MVLVFGNIGQMRKIAEGAHHLQRLHMLKAAEQIGEFLPRCKIVVAMETDRQQANALYQCKGVLSLLIAQRVAEYAAKQADVLSQRFILVAFFSVTFFHVTFILVHLGVPLLGFGAGITKVESIIAMMDHIENYTQELCRSLHWRCKK